MQIDQKRSDDTMFGSGVKLVMTQEQIHHSGPPAHVYFSGLKVATKIRHQYDLQKMTPHSKLGNCGNNFAHCFVVEVREMCFMLSVSIH